MKSHLLYEQMVARRHELTPPEEFTLSTHLDICERCREAADVYVEQDHVLRRLGNSRPSTVRRHVLARIDAGVLAARPWWRTLPFPRLPGLVHLARASAAAVCLSAVIVNSPLRDTVGAEQAPFHGWTPTSCNAEGYALINYKQILSSPAQYRGRGVTWMPQSFEEVRATIDAPVYYVFPRSPLPTACQPNVHVTDILVAVNSIDGTELHAVGITADLIRWSRLPNW
ncbi:MAG: hypothetical protein M3Z66_18435 [Chloroflexota bacterium]|nr:hypothetical protein [Chloroflexota bacterium]